MPLSLNFNHACGEAAAPEKEKHRFRGAFLFLVPRRRFELRTRRHCASGTLRVRRIMSAMLAAYAATA